MQVPGQWWSGLQFLNKLFPPPSTWLKRRREALPCWTLTNWSNRILSWTPRDTIWQQVSGLMRGLSFTTKKFWFWCTVVGWIVQSSPVLSRPIQGLSSCSTPSGHTPCVRIPLGYVPPRYFSVWHLSLKIYSRRSQMIIWNKNCTANPIWGTEDLWADSKCKYHKIGLIFFCTPINSL